MLSYKFGLEEVTTKIDILKQEYELIHDYNPIEHVKSRLKTQESILKKVQRRGFDWSMESIRENVRDIAGIRINCSFKSDIYQVSDMLQQQQDITVVEYKDYIESSPSSEKDFQEIYINGSRMPLPMDFLSLFLNTPEE